MKKSTNQEGVQDAEVQEPRKLNMEAKRKLEKLLITDRKRYLWRDLLKLRREQKQLEPEKQLTLFELKMDVRSASQSSADSRYREPTLFKID